MELIDIMVLVSVNAFNDWNLILLMPSVNATNSRWPPSCQDSMLQGDECFPEGIFIPAFTSENNISLLFLRSTMYIYNEAEWYYTHIYMQEEGRVANLTGTFDGYMAHNLMVGLLPRSFLERRGEEFGRLLFFLRCACGPKWKPIKEQFMFIKCLSKLKNFLINSNLAEAPQWLGVSPPQYRLFACYNSRLEIHWWLH